MRVLAVVSATLLAGCAPPGPATDCAKVSSWIQLAVRTAEAPPADGSKDADYEAAVADKQKIQLTEHERRFAESLQTKLTNPGPQDYAAIYALCRKWESGNY
jgi:hypothetical protein